MALAATALNEQGSFDLSFLLNNLNSDTISPGALETLVDDMKINKVKEIHPYKITPPGETNKYWRTYYKLDDMTSRGQIKCKTERGLYQKLYDIYFAEEKKELRDIYKMWMTKRETMNLSPRTLLRSDQRWIRYYEHYPIADVPISQLKPSHIEDHIHHLISEFKMKDKELKEVMSIIRGCLQFAVREGIITINPMDRVLINRAGCLPSVRKNDRSRVYLRDEIQGMFQAISNELEEYPNNTLPLAIQLEFKLGLRIGELVALRFSDIDTDEMTIHIQRMESIDRNGNPVVVNHLKKKSRESNRYLPIGDYELMLVDKIMQINDRYGYFDEDYIFVGPSGRYHIRAVDNRIRKLCHKAGIPEKSCHDIRRTVASLLHANNVPVEKIRAYMGHNDINTTWGYVYDIDSEEATKNIMKNALKELNSLDIR
jgi:integrase